MLYKLRLSIRRFIRDNSSPISQPVADKWHKRLSVLYFIFAWNALGVSVYAWQKNRDKAKDEPKEKDPYPALTYAREKNKPNAMVLKYSGFSKVGEYTFKEYEIESEVSNST